MEQSQDSPDHRPLTVGHGKKLFAKSTSISEQIDQLKPLLALLQPEEAFDQEPVHQITLLLENLVLRSQHQMDELQTIHSKLDALLEVLSVNEL